MNAPKSGEIHCPACDQDALLLREPIYEGLRKTGESLRCSSCGHAFGSEEDVPFKGRAAPAVFSEKDRSGTVRVFREGEADRLCRYCTQYVVNPFMQWCGLHKKEVQATDTCDRFERKPAASNPTENSRGPRLPNRI